VQTGAKARRLSLTALEFSAETDSPLEGVGFEPSVPRDTPKFFDAGSRHLLDSLHTEKSARTRTDITRMPAASRGTDGSNPSSSSEESANFRSLSGGRIGLRTAAPMRPSEACPIWPLAYIPPREPDHRTFGP